MQENNGLDRIEVKDDGSGIKKTDVQYVCLPSYTSKIRGYADLGKCNLCEDLLQICVHPLHHFQNAIDSNQIYGQQLEINHKKSKINMSLVHYDSFYHALRLSQVKWWRVQAFM